MVTARKYNTIKETEKIECTNECNECFNLPGNIEIILNTDATLETNKLSRYGNSHSIWTAMLKRLWKKLLCNRD